MVASDKLDGKAELRNDLIYAFECARTEGLTHEEIIEVMREFEEEIIANPDFKD